MRREAFETLLNDERRYSFGSHFGGRLRVHNKRRRNWAIGYPGGVKCT